MRPDPGYGRAGGGFTLIEVIATLVIVGMLAVFGTSMLSNVIQGYNSARNADEVVQKAQMALQRMTVEFSQIVPQYATGSATSITYNYNGEPNSIISQSGNRIVYQYNGTSYTLLDGVAAGSLRFTYFTNYNSTAMTSFANNANVNLVGITFNMQGDDTSIGVNQAYSTRVKLNKLQ